MLPRDTSRLRGFTLIELLAVIAIISLLIGLLVPAVSNIRTQANNAAIASQLKAIGDGCEMFSSAIGHYPRSSGDNPFESSPTHELSGAQWVVLQLAGADFEGYVKPDRANNIVGGSAIEPEDWRAWYDPENPADVTRAGTFVENKGDICQAPWRFAEELGIDPLPTALIDGSSDWSNADLPFFVDRYGAPVLYYRALAQAEAPFSYNRQDAVVGRYMQADNAAITGSEFAAEADYGLDMGEGHPKDVGAMYTFGWDSANPTDPPARRSFAEALYDRKLFEQTPGAAAGQGKVWPHNADRFILISPGRDRIYGTADDVKNF